MPQITRQLPVKLTDEEVRAKGEELARLHKDAVDLDDRKKREAAFIRDEIKELAGKIADVAKDVRSRTETRSVPCHEVLDSGAGIARIYRDDTGELVDSRPLEPHELQTKLFPIDGGRRAARAGDDDGPADVADKPPRGGNRRKPKGTDGGNEG